MIIAVMTPVTTTATPGVLTVEVTDRATACTRGASVEMIDADRLRDQQREWNRDHREVGRNDGGFPARVVARHILLNRDQYANGGR